jgi:hypothetical protein
MSDVFSVLRADHAEVRQMLLALEASPGCAAGAGQSVLAARKEVVARLVIESARHQAAEAELLRPVVRRRLGGGGRLAGQATAQQRRVRAVLARLGQLEPTDRDFDRLVTELIPAARREMEFEEASVWPALRQVLSPAESQDLGSTMERARQHHLLRPRPVRRQGRARAGAVLRPGAGAR